MSHSDLITIPGHWSFDYTYFAGESATRERGWPKNGTALTAALKRLAPSLRAAGIEWLRLPRTGAIRPHSIRTIGGKTVTSVTADTASGADRDGSGLTEPEDRHASTPTVIPHRDADDGHDGHDGRIALEPTGAALLAEAFRIFGGDISALGGPDE